MPRQWIGSLALVLLVVMLLLATRQDLRFRRISNRLVLIGIALGLALNGLLPAGQGFNSVMSGGLGWYSAAAGLVLGIILLLPMYLLRAMGAGDLKLMGMVGAFLGAADLIGALIATLVVGGVMALLAALWEKQLLHRLQNIKFILFGSLLTMHAGQLLRMRDLSLSGAKLPYAVAITAGTSVYLVWQRMSS